MCFSCVPSVCEKRRTRKMPNKKKIFIYSWEGVFSPFVAGYAYFIVDQLQTSHDLKEYLDRHGGRWLVNHQRSNHPVLYRILCTIDHLTFGDKMQLVYFVDTYKSKLLDKHNNFVTIPSILHVKIV